MPPVSSKQPRASSRSDGQNEDSTSGILEPVSLAVLLQFAGKRERALLVIGIIADFAAGASFPLMIVFFGDALDALNSACTDTQAINDSVMDTFYSFIYVGAGALAAKMISTICIGHQKETSIARWKKEYMKAILRQDVGWYDVNHPESLSTLFGESLTQVEAGLGGSVWSQMPFGLGQIFTGFALAFVYNWSVTLVACIFVPYVLYGIWLLAKTQREAAAVIAKAYAQSGGAASEALSSIRTVARGWRLRLHCYKSEWH